MNHPTGAARPSCRPPTQAEKPAPSVPSVAEQEAASKEVREVGLELIGIKNAMNERMLLFELALVFLKGWIF